MNSFSISIITPNGQVFDGKVESIVAPGQEGSFGVLAGHLPMVAVLKEGILKLKHNLQDVYFVISKGVLEINSEGYVLLLIDDVFKADSLEQAKEKIKGL